MQCNWKNCQNILAGRQTKFCSKACKNKYYVTKNRTDNKKRLVDALGGKCSECNYKKYIGALQFHHPNPDKEYGISDRGWTRSYETLLKEAKKCVLLCANCHAEEHHKLRIGM